VANYERLSALDASFLGLEDESYHMHVGSVMIFDVGPLRTSSGGIDIEGIRDAIEAHLQSVPRFRQRLAYIPYERMPVWVDDDRFRLAYHVRHTALPQPGDERMLKRLVGRIMSQPLDRKRPLWEMWVVEGLQGDRFALISKTHHCMIDGISGADVMSVILEPSPRTDTPPPRPWKARRCPSNARLVFEEIRRRAAQPPEVLQALYGALRHPEETLREVTETAVAIVHTVAPALSPVSQTPINVDVGPHRRFDWTDMQLADLKMVKNVLGGTINDVVLATVAGALRVFFTQRGVDPDELEIRGLVPVSVRTQDQRGRLGNRVAEMIVPLPVKIRGPVARLRFVQEATAALKESHQALGAQVLTAISDWTVPNLLVQAVRLASKTRPYNLIVTNIPGPQIPLYLRGALMRTAYPVVPLYENLGLVVGLFSYNGGVYWGFNADWEQLLDLHDFVLAIESSFRALQDAARRAAERVASASAPQRRRRPKAAAHIRPVHVG
jgi:WS/DGAT/MGAT family acyltransferase